MIKLTNKKPLVIIVLLLMVLVVSGCDLNDPISEDSPIDSSEVNLEIQAQQALTYYEGNAYSQTSMVRKVERIHIETAEAFESYGGLWADTTKENTYIIGVKKNAFNTGNKNKINDQLKEKVNEIIKPVNVTLEASQRTYEIVEVVFSYKELSNYRDLLNPILHNRSDVVETYIDFQKNVFSIGVTENFVRSSIHDLLESYSISKDAVNIYKTEPVQLASINKNFNFPHFLQSTPTLRDYYRPVQGGLQIRSDGGVTCTFGFNIKLDGVGMWVTNSHCTSVFSGSDNSNFYQNNQNISSHYIGSEYRDFQGYGTTGNQWRYSDAALIDMDSGVSSRFGAITTTATTAWGGWGNPSNLEIGSIYTYKQITGERTSNLQGELLHKTGRTTGTTKGLVNSTCVDVSNILQLPGWTLKCQIRASIYGQPGDSGSPLYYDGLYLPQAVLVGIQWGINNGLEVSYFSHINAVRDELTIGNENLETH